MSNSLALSFSSCSFSSTSSSSSSSSSPRPMPVLPKRTVTEEKSVSTGDAALNALIAQLKTHRIDSVALEQAQGLLDLEMAASSPERRKKWREVSFLLALPERQSIKDRIYFLLTSNKPKEGKDKIGSSLKEKIDSFLNKSILCRGKEVDGFIEKCRVHIRQLHVMRCRPMVLSEESKTESTSFSFSSSFTSAVPEASNLSLPNLLKEIGRSLNDHLSIIRGRNSQGYALNHAQQLAILQILRKLAEGILQTPYDKNSPVDAPKPLQLRLIRQIAQSMNRQWVLFPLHKNLPDVLNKLIRNMIPESAPVRETARLLRVLDPLNLDPELHTVERLSQLDPDVMIEDLNLSEAEEQDIVDDLLKKSPQMKHPSRNDHCEMPLIPGRDLLRTRFWNDWLKLSLIRKAIKQDTGRYGQTEASVGTDEVKRSGQAAITVNRGFRALARFLYTEHSYPHGVSTEELSKLAQHPELFGDARSFAASFSNDWLVTTGNTSEMSDYFLQMVNMLDKMRAFDESTANRLFGILIASYMRTHISQKTRYLLGDEYRVVKVKADEKTREWIVSAILANQEMSLAFFDSPTICDIINAVRAKNPRRAEVCIIRFINEGDDLRFLPLPLTDFTQDMRQQITCLDLREINWSGESDEDAQAFLNMFPNLLKLRIRGSNLSSLTPTLAMALTDLSICTQEEFELPAKMPNLVHLKLSNTGCLLLDEMPALQTLCLEGGSKITKIPDLPNVRRIVIKNCIGGRKCEHLCDFGAMPRLNTLIILGKIGTNILPIDKMPNLRHLELIDGAFKNVPVKAGLQIRFAKGY